MMKYNLFWGIVLILDGVSYFFSVFWLIDRINKVG